MLHTGYSVRITPSGGSATLINGIVSQSVRTGPNHVAEPTAGNLYANFVSVNALKPGASFSSYDLLTLIPLLGLRGACLAGGANPGAEFFQLALEACGTVRTGSNHRKLTIPNGLAVPRTLSVSHQADATMDCEVLSYWDGTNNPVIIAASQAAPTGLAVCNRYTLGPISIGGVVINGVTSLSIDFGNQAVASGAGSDLYDSNIEVPGMVPRITIRGRNVAKFADSSAIPLIGIAGSHANTTIVLRKRTPSLGSFSDGADNILITAACAVNFDEVFNASANSHGDTGLILTAFDDGTNAPLVITTNYDLTP